MKGKRAVVALAMLLTRGVASAQIPVEVLAGHHKTTMDIMFFKFFKNTEGKNTRFLFFNRNRAGIDYSLQHTPYFTQFGFTEAVSYNHEKLSGFAPVAVASVLNTGVYPKAGIQFSNIRNEYTMFSWLVSETLRHPNIDFFLLGRFTPKIGRRLNLFSQIELLSTFPTVSKRNFSFTQRFRLGVKVKAFQVGAGVDSSEYGRVDFTVTTNVGGFLRYEF